MKRDDMRETDRETVKNDIQLKIDKYELIRLFFDSVSVEDSLIISQFLPLIASAWGQLHAK